MGKQTTISRIWHQIGRLMFWVVWPMQAITLPLRPPRTRVIIKYQNKVLLIRDWLGNGTWTLPGGGLHIGEAVEAGAARELLEETGVSVPTSKFKIVGQFKSRGSGIPVRIIGLIQEVSSLPDVKIRKGEVASYAWVDVSQLQELPLHATALVVLKTARLYSPKDT